MELNFEGLEMQNEIHQQIELKEKMKKNDVICLVIMFISRIMIIKMSKMAHFFVLSVDDSNKAVTVLIK